ncbi:MAG: hypothetical protein ACW98X_24885 [Promethearchaeota archaeon]|jgi:hypothetical protein
MKDKKEYEFIIQWEGEWMESEDTVTATTGPMLIYAANLSEAFCLAERYKNYDCWKPELEPPQPDDQVNWVECDVELWRCPVTVLNSQEPSSFP